MTIRVCISPRGEGGEEETGASKMKLSSMIRREAEKEKHKEADRTYTKLVILKNANTNSSSICVKYY